MLKIALLQIKTSPDYRENFRNAVRLLKQTEPADITVLPESFLFPFGSDSNVPPDEIERMLNELAALVPSVFIAGTVPEKTESGNYNTAFVFNNYGRERLGKYRKVHLFDVDLPGVTTNESDRYRSGEKAEIIETPYGKVGIAVCYDIRFPEQFIDYAHQDARLMIVPASFSAVTGPLHWEVLNRARALDSQSFVLACTPAENHELDFPVYAGTMVTDPYGQVMARADKDEEILYAELDMDYPDKVRRELPTLKLQEKLSERD